jgi:hypothetical protein
VTLASFRSIASSDSVLAHSLTYVLSQRAQENSQFPVEFLSDRCATHAQGL